MINCIKIFTTLPLPRFQVILQPKKSNKMWSNSTCTVLILFYGLVMNNESESYLKALPFQNDNLVRIQ